MAGIYIQFLSAVILGQGAFFGITMASVVVINSKFLFAYAMSH